MYTPDQIADYFLSNIDVAAGDSISPLKLQKLLYYSQAWHYTIFGTQLFEEDFKAWVHGPVLWSQYRRFAGIRTGNINISNYDLDVPEFEGNTLRLLEDIRRLYGERSSSYLEELTHSEDPWKNARVNLQPHQRCDNTISLDSMKEYYTKLLPKRA